MFKHAYLAAVLLLLAVLVAACAPGAALSGSGAVSTVTDTAQPAQAVETPAAPAPSGGTSFVLFDKQSGSFRSYGIDGSVRYESPAPGLQYPSFYTITVLKDAVYYATEGQEKQIFRSSKDGAKKLDLTVAKLSAFKVSPDEKWIAWSVFNGDSQPVSSQLWIGTLDGKGGVADAKQIASYTLDSSSALWLVPIKWAENNSGVLYFERSMIGLGGYILYGGHFSLYGYDIASGQITTYVAAEENRGMCLDTFRLDLNKVAFNCGKDSNLVTIRDLSSSKDVDVPALSEQGVSGSSEFSPSGKWLAYAVARNNPDDEAGQVAVVAADLGSAPRVIYKVAQKRYPVVQGWLNDDTLLVTVTNFTEPPNTVITMKQDGTGVQEIASGQFVGWIK